MAKLLAEQKCDGRMMDKVIPKCRSTSQGTQKLYLRKLSSPFFYGSNAHYYHQVNASAECYYHQEVWVDMIFLKYFMKNVLFLKSESNEMFVISSSMNCSKWVVKLIFAENLLQTKLHWQYEREIASLPGGSNSNSLALSRTSACRRERKVHYHHLLIVLLSACLHQWFG